MAGDIGCPRKAPLSNGDTGWWGTGGDIRDKMGMVGTRMVMGPRKDGGHQSGTTRVRKGWWGPGGDNGDQEEMMGIRRRHWSARGDGGYQEVIMETRRSQWR